MKTDLAIYSYVLGIFIWCKSVGLVISNKLDFNSCAVRDGFCKSSHILQVQLYYKQWTVPKSISVVFPSAINISFISQLLLVTKVTSLVFL